MMCRVIHIMFLYCSTQTEKLHTVPHLSDVGQLIISGCLLVTGTVIEFAVTSLGGVLSCLVTVDCHWKHWKTGLAVCTNVIHIQSECLQRCTATLIHVCHLSLR